jgi:hypothetical protein
MRRPNRTENDRAEFTRRRLERVAEIAVEPGRANGRDVPVAGPRHRAGAAG